jgi:hypothetical protein
VAGSTAINGDAIMPKQIHKRFSSDEVKDVLGRYVRREVGVEQAYALLKISRRRFFDLLGVYRKNPEAFQVEYQRKGANRKLAKKVDQKIVGELKKEARLIEDKDNPIRDFNYSFIREILAEKHHVQVSLSTVIDRAKKMGFTKRGKFASATTARS